MHCRIISAAGHSPVKPLALALLLMASSALACEMPDAGGSLSMRRLVTRVQLLPETEAWRKSLPEGMAAQFVLLVHSPERIRGRCYWPVEARAGGELWRRFLVAGDGGRVLTDPRVNLPR
jgi:hypothetical protein